MNVEVVVSDNFRKEAKKYLKKFHSLKQELLDLEQSLREDPKQGAPLAGATYKIRLASKSKGKGKSGGFRIITYLVESVEGDNGEPLIVVTLLSIYDKSEISTLSEAYISALVAHYLQQQAALDE
jgi:mRNA-degrading endonuclease RelE of RelBE toxin-antitoxin system